MIKSINRLKDNKKKKRGIFNLSRIKRKLLIKKNQLIISLKAIMCMIRITRIQIESINIPVAGVQISTKLINNSRTDIKTSMINNSKLKVITHKVLIIMILRAMKRKSIIVKHNMRMIMAVEVLIATIIKTATIKSIRPNM